MKILITNDDGINAPGLKVLEAIAAEHRRSRRRGLDRGTGVRAVGRRPLHQLHPPDDDRRAWPAPLRRRRLARRLRAGRHPRRDARKARPGAVGRQPRQQRRRERALFRHHRRRDGGGAAGDAGDRAEPVLGPGQRHAGRSVRGRAQGSECRPCATSLRMATGRRPITGCSTTSTFRPARPPRSRAARSPRRACAAGVAFGVEPHFAPSGRKFLWIKGGTQHIPSGPGTDGTANVEGYVSITPMRCDLTAHDTLTALRERLE